MRMQIFFFLTFIGVFLLGIHFFVYVSLAKISPSFVAEHRSSLLSALVFLSLSFVVAMALIHWKENIFTRAFYFFSGEWLGFLTNLVLAFVVMWIVVGVAKIFSVDISVASLGIFLLVIAFFVSVYGIVNAFHPRLREVSVRIPNLPEEWRGKRIIQLSDVHLGSIYREDFLRSVVARVNAVRPEVVVITGDLFDGMDGFLDTLVAPLDDIESRYGVFFVTGNHETYLGVDEVFASLQRTKVSIIDNAVVDVAGLKIIGMSYPPRGADEDVAGRLALLRPDFVGQPNILLHHAPTHIDEFRAAGINLQLSGHTHKGQQYPFGLITWWLYKGFDYGLREIGDYSIYTTNGVGTWGPAMRVGNIPEIVVITLQKK